MCEAGTGQQVSQPYVSYMMMMKVKMQRFHYVTLRQVSVSAELVEACLLSQGSLHFHNFHTPTFCTLLTFSGMNC
jgi:hypothetical protein